MLFSWQINDDDDDDDDDAGADDDDDVDDDDVDDVDDDDNIQILWTLFRLFIGRLHVLSLSRFTILRFSF